MALAGSGLLAIWNDIDAGLRDEFLEWHPRQHLPERLGNPGFLQGRRFAALDADIEFFTMYEGADIEVFASAAYMAQSRNPSAWSQRVTAGFRNNLRGVCRVSFTRGPAAGAFLMALRVHAADGNSASLERALCTSVLPPLVDQPRITGVHYAICDPLRSNAKARAQGVSTLVLPDHVILVEGSAADGVREATQALLPDELLESSGAVRGTIRGQYQLECWVSNLLRDESASREGSMVSR